MSFHTSGLSQAPAVLWITPNLLEIGISSRWLQSHFLHLTITEYFITYFLIFVMFSTSGRVVALVTADISVALLHKGMQQTLQKVSSCPQGSSFLWFLNFTRMGEDEQNAHEDGQNEIQNFILSPGLTLYWKEVLDNFNHCSNSGKSLSIRSHFSIASSQCCPEQQTASLSQLCSCCPSSSTRLCLPSYTPPRDGRGVSQIERVIAGPKYSDTCSEFQLHL